MARSRTATQAKKFAGNWKFRDGKSEVEFEIRISGGNCHVSVSDSANGEVADVNDVASNAKTLSFAAHWSPKRLIKYRLTPSPVSTRIEATSAHIVTELWERFRKNHG